MFLRGVPYFIKVTSAFLISFRLDMPVDKKTFIFIFYHDKYKFFYDFIEYCLENWLEN